MEREALAVALGAQDRPIGGGAGSADMQSLRRKEWERAEGTEDIDRSAVFHKAATNAA